MMWSLWLSIDNCLRLILLTPYRFKKFYLDLSELNHALIVPYLVSQTDLHRRVIVLLFIFLKGGILLGDLIISWVDNGVIGDKLLGILVERWLRVCLTGILNLLNQVHGQLEFLLQQIGILGIGSLVHGSLTQQKLLVLCLRNDWHLVHGRLLLSSLLKVAQHDFKIILHGQKIVLCQRSHRFGLIYVDSIVDISVLVLATSSTARGWTIVSHSLWLLRWHHTCVKLLVLIWGLIHMLSDSLSKLILWSRFVAWLLVNRGVLIWYLILTILL